MSALISLKKVRVENLPVDSHEEVPDRFRVRFRSENVAAETPSKQAGADGSIEWNEPLDMRVFDASAKVVAVIQQYNPVGGWIVRPDRQFESLSVNELPDTWLHTPDLPTAPTFRAELSVHGEEEEAESAASTHEPGENFSEIPPLDSPGLLYSLGRGAIFDGGDVFKIFSPISVTASSVTTSSSTLTRSSSGRGAFFGEGADAGITAGCSPVSSARSILPPPPVSPISSPPRASPTAPPPPVSPAAAPPLNDDMRLRQGVLSAAAGAEGLTIRFLRPELAVSRSFSWSPAASPAAQPSRGTCEMMQQQKQRQRSPGGEVGKGSALTAPFRRGLPSPSARSWYPNVFRSASVDDVSKSDRLSEAPTVPGSPADTTVDGQQGKAPVQPHSEISSAPDAALSRYEKTEASLRRAFRTKEGEGSDGVASVGDEDLAIAAILDDLGRGLREAGRPDEAEGFLKRALQIKEARLEPESVHVSWTLHELALHVREADNSGEARVALRKALQGEKAELGPDDIGVGFMPHGLGSCEREAGQAEGADDVTKPALDGEEAELYRDDESVSTTVPELPECLREVSLSEETEENSERSLELETAKSDCTDTTSGAPTLHELGRCLRAMGLPEQAEQVFTQDLQDKISHLGPQAPEVAVTQHELGLCLRATGQTARAEELLRQALPIKKSKHGARHPQVAVTLHELGKSAREAGRPEEAEDYLREALAIQESELGTHYRDVAETLHELALSLSQTGRPDEAEDLFKQSLHVKNTKLAPDDLLDVATLHELGRGLRAAGRLGEAEKHFQQALRLSEANYGPYDLQVAWTLHELGRCVREAGRPDEGEELLQQAVQLQEAKLGPDRTSAGWTLYDLGLCPKRSGRLLVEIEIEEIVKQVDELLNYLQRRMTAQA